MGMFSEIIAEVNSKKIEKILVHAINTNNPEIFNFIKKYLYPYYLDECGEAWTPPNPDIVEKFKRKLK